MMDAYSHYSSIKKKANKPTNLTTHLLQQLSDRNYFWLSHLISFYRIF